MTRQNNKGYFSLSHILEMIGAVLFYFVAQLLGLDRSSRVCGRLLEKVGPKLKRHKTAHTNLKRAQPELNKAQRDEVIQTMWYNMGRTIGEYPHLAKFRKKKYQNRIEFVVSPEASAALEKHKGRCFFLSGHFTNWELMPIALPLFFNIEGVEVYMKLTNPYSNFWVRRLREKYICPNQVEKQDAVRAILRHVKANRPFCALVDQKMLSGRWTFFFHQPAATSTFAAVLALKQNYALLPSYIERIGDGKKVLFRIVIGAPLEVETEKKDTKATIKLTQEINYCLEGIIRRQPQNYLWLHNRWLPPGKERRQARKWINARQ